MKKKNKDIIYINCLILVVVTWFQAFFMLKNWVMENLAGLFIEIDINNLIEVTEYFDAICGVTSKNFTGVGMLRCVQINHFKYLGTFDGKKLSFTTKVDLNKKERIITIEELKDINYKVYLHNNKLK